jgi:hypothetical protein
MPKFVIERTMPGVGNLPEEELAEMMTASCEVVKTIGPQIQWIESYVTDDKVYCIYVAPDAETVRHHAMLGGFPADSVLVVKRVIDPLARVIRRGDEMLPPAIGA